MIKKYHNQISGYESAIEMGAGIGRVSKATLLPRFKNVDLLEPAPAQIKEAESNVPDIRKFYNMGMQEYVFEDKYDAVWLQWCLSYLTDSDLHDFLIKTRDNLREEVDPKSKALKHGLIFVKENVSPDEFLIYKDENSIMRTEKHFNAIFEDAGFDILTQFY